MTSTAQWIGAATLALYSSSALAAADRAPPNMRNFVACPIVLDTQPVPCFVAKSGGETYYLTVQSDISPQNIYPPQLKHQVLVEGEVTSEPRRCGGIVLKNIKLSPMPEVDPTCDQILPGGKYTTPFAPRAAGPSNRGTKLATDLSSGPPARRAPPELKPPFKAEDFTVLFDFDNDYMYTRETFKIMGAVRLAQASNARIEIHGYRGVSLLSDAPPLVEKPEMAERRAQKVAKALRELGFPADRVQTNWSKDAEPADGIGDTARRRVVLHVVPAEGAAAGM